MPFACVLISDITGSTRLYETESNRAALSHVSYVLSRMREIVEQAGGHCVKSQGDDVLSFFAGAEPAFAAALSMLQEDWPAGMSVHAGIYSGEILSHENDIYGTAVNTAARLSSLAKPGEVLIGDRCFDDLPAAAQARLVMIGELHLRGKSALTRVYSCSLADLSEQTVLFARTGAGRAARIEMAELRHDGQVWQLGEGDMLTLGRATDCDIVLDLPWVSRQHAALAIRRWQLEFRDHSSAGSVLKLGEAEPFSVHRRTTLITGSGTIWLGPEAGAGLPGAIDFTTQAMQIRHSPAGSP